MNAPPSPKLSESLTRYAERVKEVLQIVLPPAGAPPEMLHQAMSYAVMNGGKRIRPALVYATGEAIGVPLQELDITAAAVEIIHCYSLIHDDLPCMDDDDLRRGVPTCHKAFDEATAILAGDALQALAFEILCGNQLPGPSPEIRCKLAQILAHCSGSSGMAGGQALDLIMAGQAANIDQLETMHRKKTGSLICGSILMTAAYRTLPEIQHQALARFGETIGLAFQVRDDILDEISDTDTLGKPQGSDIAHQKPTYVSVLGLTEAQKKCDDLLGIACEALTLFDYRADTLRALSEYIIARSY